MCPKKLGSLFGRIQRHVRGELPEFESWEAQVTDVFNEAQRAVTPHGGRGKRLRAGASAIALGE